MDDMTDTLAAKSEQLTADDLIGRTLTITITGGLVNMENDQPARINFEGDNGKPWYPCKIMRRVLAQVWQSPRVSEYVGRRVTLYRDAKVTFGALAVGGIRISHMSHIDKEVVIAVQERKGSKKPYKVLPLRAEPIAAPPPAAPAASKWLTQIKARLDRCVASDQVTAISAREDVRKAMQEAPESFRTELQTMLTEAADRVSYVPGADLDDDAAAA